MPPDDAVSSSMLAAARCLQTFGRCPAAQAFRSSPAGGVQSLFHAHHDPWLPLLREEPGEPYITLQ